MLSRTIDAIQMLAEAGVPVKINTVVSRRNAASIPRLANQFAALPDNVRYWSLFQYSPIRSATSLERAMSIARPEF